MRRPTPVGIVRAVGSAAPTTRLRTGPYPLVEQSVGETAVLRKRDGWWGRESFLDEVIYVDLGDAPSAIIGALASQQVHGQYTGTADVNTLDVLKSLFSDTRSTRRGTSSPRSSPGRAEPIRLGRALRPPPPVRAPAGLSVVAE